jgi:hypothetical protein
MEPTEDQLLEAAPLQPAARKLSRLRKASSTPKALPPPSPFDQNAEPNKAGPRLPTPAASPSSPRPTKEEAAEQPERGDGSEHASDDEGEREKGAEVRLLGLEGACLCRHMLQLIRRSGRFRFAPGGWWLP